MAKKKKHPEHENLERWLVSYADFITLLFATFTALYALSQTDLAKFKDVGKAIQEGFEQQSLIHGKPKILSGEGGEKVVAISAETGPNGILDKYRAMVYRPGEIEAESESMQETAAAIKKDLEALKDELAAGAKDKNGEDTGQAIRPVDISMQDRGLRISFDSRLLFAPGNVALRPSARKALDVVGARLRKYYGNIVQVEGHTDNLPISSALFPSNWELSSARAGSVIRYMSASQNMSPDRFVAVGYGDTQPLASNKTSEGRARNRRVDLLLLNKLASAVDNPQQQFMHEVTVPLKRASSERPAPPKTHDYRP